jgi:hypothetical protein
MRHDRRLRDFEVRRRDVMGHLVHDKAPMKCSVYRQSGAERPFAAFREWGWVKFFC